jgi:hypothetical protein
MWCIQSFRTSREETFEGLVRCESIKHQSILEMKERDTIIILGK